MEFTGIIITALGVLAGIILGAVKKNMKQTAFGIVIGSLIVGSSLTFIGTQGLGAGSLSLSSGTQSSIDQIGSEIKESLEKAKTTIELGGKSLGEMINWQ